MEIQVKSRLKEKLYVLDSQKNVTSSRKLGMEEKTRMYEGVVVPTVFYKAEPWGWKHSE